MAAGLLWMGGCTAEPDPASGPPQFVTTIPPFAMILEPLVAGRGSVHTLLAPGQSPHTYDPSPSDRRAVRRSTAIVYGAAHLDGWAADFDTDARVALLDVLPAGARLRFEEGTVDPHFWTSPQAVTSLISPLADTLCALDRAGCDTYRANADSLLVDLSALDARLETMMAPVRDAPVMLAQPFFRYFLADYGPRLVGVVEPRPGKEPTPRQIQATTERVRSTDAQALLTQDALSPRAARAVSEATSVPLIPLDLLGGPSKRTTYERLLLDNAHRLRSALSSPGP
jgi:ABC-type Zn uptake system ZnuABC Zn-binding protein ZnuA